MVGANLKTITIYEHDARYEDDFLVMREYIKKQLKGVRGRILHVNETSVNLVYSEPIVDVLVALDDRFDVTHVRNLLSHQNLLKIDKKASNTERLVYYVVENGLLKFRIYVCVVGDLFFTAVANFKRWLSMSTKNVSFYNSWICENAAINKDQPQAFRRNRIKYIMSFAKKR